ncbi:MAG: DUF4402 domain-containing protein, partial [Pseudomonadota bacterium]
CIKGSEDFTMEKTKKGSTPSKALMMGAALVTLTGLSAQEVQAASATGPMSAIILTPITFSATEELHFGSMTVGMTTGDDVVIVADGTRPAIITGGQVTLVAGMGFERQGQFIINSGAAGSLDIQVSIAAGLFTVSNGTSTMGVGSFDVETGPLDAGNQNTIVITNAANTVTVDVGATLTVNPNQAAGTYTGNYTINANYQ